MKLVVCIKQVPEIADIKFDIETKRLIRDGVPAIVNPFDRRALAEAIRLRDLHGGEVVVVTMGPMQARSALIECLAAGADRGVHLLDPAFAGSDSLATARTLALALAKEKADLILCGKYSIDAETGQVGPELAELLDIPQVTGATRIEPGSEEGYLLVERETDEGFELIECRLPVLLTAAERLVRPIKVKEAQLESGRTKPIDVITAPDLSSDQTIFGLQGSPTVVCDIRSIARTRKVEMIEGAGAAGKAANLVEKLGAGGFFDRQDVEPVASATQVRSTADNGREVWIVAELMKGKLRPVTFELLGEGLELANELGGVVAALVAGEGAGDQVNTLAAYGAEKVYFAEDDSLSRYTTARYTSLLVQAIQTYQPVVVLLPSTANGRDLAPRVAARIAVGLTADCIGLEINDRGELVQHKPAFGGNIVALITSRTLPQMATVRPGMFKAMPPDHSRSATVTCLPVPMDRVGGLESGYDRARLVSVRSEISEDISDLEEARAIVCVGAGIGSPENLPVIAALASAAGAVIGGTRRVVDNGWLPRQQQIGLTGKIVSPRLYVAVAVRGSFNHTIGIQQAGIIVAVNNDPDAEIFRSADLGIVADWAEFVPALTERLKIGWQRTDSQSR